ncbi:nuclear transport factor 2 family protein [Vibrio sp. CAIM 722]|uniref:Nuclear transport factor 2 family protein n=2 Tax=Vibrio TaxID=662 RepID=A0A7X4LLV0_9VIBR|nr:nuclear transport factor 2 family protein [Vibrio eleionomae]MZI94175.1 nuclear transport factor 2 family protein [Vibrio eleionomae]
MTPKDVVIAYWKAMNSNDFTQASEWLAPEFQGHWVQSSELIEGRDNFVAINSQYPANGRWQFVIHSIVAENNTVVTDVSITDSVVNDRVITFHTVEYDLIVKQVEYFPDNYPAPEW